MSTPSRRLARKVTAPSLRMAPRSRWAPPCQKKYRSSSRAFSSLYTAPPAYAPMAASPERVQRVETMAPGFTLSFCSSATSSKGWHSSTSPNRVDTVTLRNLVMGSMPM